MSPRDAVLRHVAHEVGTPAYVYDAAALRARAAALWAALPDVDFFYSLKANPNLSVVRVLLDEGLGCEVCSRMEMETCVAAGADPRRMIVVGPAKSEADLARAVSLGVKAVILESVQEVARLEAAAAARGRTQAVGLRVNPAFHVPGARLSMSGKPTQFGVDEADLEAALASIEAAPHLRLDGLHVYMGTRILEAGAIVANTRAILLLAERVAALTGRRLDFVDVGGGFGVPYAEAEVPLDLAALGAALRPVLAEGRWALPGTRVVIELGRYLVAEAGSFLTRVRYTKTSKGTRFAVCDGGTNCHAAAGQGALYRRNFPMRRVGPPAGPAEPWTITGPLCTPADVIGAGVETGPLSPGDLIRVDASGAYGPSASPTGFLGFGAPIEILCDGPELSVIRERPTVADALALQTPRILSGSGAPRPLETA